jgi:P-type Cu+ transporter
VWQVAESMGSCCACEREESRGGWVRLGVAAAVAAQSMVFGLAVNVSPPTGAARAVLHGALAVSAVVVFVLAGVPLVKRSWRALVQGRIVFDQLFLAGILAAFGASVHCTLTGTGHVYYEIVAILLAIYTFGGLITETRRKAALDAAGSLGAEFSQCEVIRDGGRGEVVDVGQVVEGDIVWVRSGGAVCVDGVVVGGVSFVREAALTGEPFPVVKREGDMVRAGSYAVEGGLKVRASRSGRGRGLDALFEALRRARSKPARLQREADRLAAWFLPVVLVVAAGTLVYWTAVSGWEQALFHALAVVLVACPCAMGIATPVAVWSALAKFVRAGLSPKDADLVEKLARTQVVVFDKTGTLGEEAMELVDFVAAKGLDRAGLRSMAAAIESASSHPVARAFRPFDHSGHRVVGTRLLPGAGIEGRLADGRVVAVGNDGVVDAAQRAAAGDLVGAACGTSGGARLIHVVVDGLPAGVGVLRETLRAGAREAIAEIEAMGVRCEVMTGDSVEAAEALDLPGTRANLLPGDKARFVREIEEAGERVLFVGDGINDAPAMAAASAAVAIHSGTALAIEASDAVLGGGNLPAIPEAIATARHAVRAIRGNLLFAACYNAVGIVLAAMGFLHPVAAALIMLASSFTVTWRALRDAEPGGPAAGARDEGLPPVSLPAPVHSGGAVS